MKLTVKNPTGKTKAVRVAGGHKVIKPGKSADIDVVFDEAEGRKYEAAGLVFSKPGAAKGAGDKTQKRLGLEKQAEKGEVTFTDETSDADLLEAIKAKKAAK